MRQKPASRRGENEPVLYRPVCSTRVSELKCKLVRQVWLLHELRRLLLTTGSTNIHSKRVRQRLREEWKNPRLVKCAELLFNRPADGRSLLREFLNHQPIVEMKLID
jgi:hypothetical protein